ncbi:hypothetical protein DAEQUDRAFT_277884 [Daedalea quercina L-15889]|uniref:Uncharacterized protein n=1 Tax=Daedalea quercina L-15889 TaxID=1314783 RepID=A0A165Q897_9APHY|nr:hypothetical protein DAEQUDRAFT_277884 [Daedalea quercina L-15889]
MPLSHKVQSAIKSRADALARTPSPNFAPPSHVQFAPMCAFQKTVLSLYPLQTLPVCTLPLGPLGRAVARAPMVCTFPPTLPNAGCVLDVSSAAAESVASTFVSPQHDTSLSVSDDLGIAVALSGRTRPVTVGEAERSAVARRRRRHFARKRQLLARSSVSRNECV